jgi:ADP-heptose:LPS heptosyltransferase
LGTGERCDPVSAPHIAVVNFTRMGDIIQSGPFLRALKASRRECRLTLIVFERFADVARRLPMVDEVIPFDVDRLAAELDGHGNFQRAHSLIMEFLQCPELRDVTEVCNLSHTPVSATFCKLIGGDRVSGMRRTAKGRISVRGDWFHYLLSIMEDRRFNPFNLAEIYLPMAQFHGRVFGLEFTITDDDRKNASHLLREAGIASGDNYVVLQAGASSASRQWPTSSFAELTSRLGSSGLRSVLVGAASENALAEQIRSNSSEEVVSLVGKTSIGTLAAVLEGAHKLVSNDTGTIHLAAAVGTPTVGIYLGPAAAKDTAPYGSNHIIIEADLPCAPCGYKHVCNSLECHAMISPQDVHRLVTATDDDISPIAAEMRGIRIVKTEVGRKGEMRLHRLNTPQHSPDDATLDIYRSFWNILFGTGESKIANGLVVGRSGVRELQEIAVRARQSIQALRNEANRSDVRTTVLSDLLRGQALWHNDLRRFSEAFPEFSALPRFLLARIATARTESLEQYLEDSERTLQLLENGLALLESAAESPLPKTQEYAAA